MGVKTFIAHMSCTLIGFNWKKKEVQYDWNVTAGIEMAAMFSILPLTLFSLLQLGSGFDTGTLLFT